MSSLLANNLPLLPERRKQQLLPKEIKASNVILCVENYRPISILDCLSKVLGRLQYDKLYTAVRSLISEFQHGLTKKRSTNLMTFINTLVGAIEKRRQVDIDVYIDFSKTFDKVHMF
ncbi:uncharacterized protein LOC129761590 [Toxorhynchites rutilus septentrionalis]|uniref:uncharacterized protein LOC129761590 n=1 Tax=Toxorhynchites rutilus septentrionalis TaxID=329112 RepID=UPI00247A24F7|nr:uncharacterized protein LOC129761590 [Toxorhynchites rutilus septentrionalis]